MKEGGRLESGKCMALGMSITDFGHEECSLGAFSSEGWRRKQFAGWCQRLPSYTYVHVLLLPLRTREEYSVLWDCHGEDRDTSADVNSCACPSSDWWKNADCRAANAHCREADPITLAYLSCLLFNKSIRQLEQSTPALLLLRHIRILDVSQIFTVWLMKAVA